MKTKRRLTILSLLSIACLIAVLAGCGPSPITPLPPTDTPLPPTGPIVLQTDQFARNEIILTGKRPNVEALAASFGLTLIATIDLSYLDQKGPVDVSFPPPLQNKISKIETKHFFVDYTSLVIQLYQNNEDISTLLDRVTDLNALNNQGQPDSDKVYADPNYLTDPLDSGSCGGQYSGGGLPHSGGGSPFAGLGKNVTISSWKHQWAFLDSPDIGGSIDFVDAFPGAQVTVGVFDTSPYPGDESALYNLPNGTELTISDTIMKYPRPETVTPNSGTSATSTPVPADNTVKDHGWFVAGLIGNMVPDSRLFLYRVLDDQGCGDLFTLSAGIHEFLKLMSMGLPDRETMDKVVINLSLGVHVPDELYYTTGKFSPDEATSDPNKPPEIFSLETTIYEAFHLGAVIVAASGNDSASHSINSPLPAQKMQLPAQYNAVLAVAANNKDGLRSCFSNQGDIAAPGGDGGVNPQDATKPCASRAASAWATPNACPSNPEMCSYGVIGPSALSTITGWGLWSGTSFASPIAAGTAALLLQEIVGNRKMTVNDQNSIYCAILAGAQQTNDPALGKGILNVKESIAVSTDVSTAVSTAVSSANGFCGLLN